METTAVKNLDEFLENGIAHLIVFKMGQEEYGVPINCIQEIIVKQETTKMPQSPKFVEGIINLRGKIIPVIDGKKKFGLNATKSETEEKIMVVDIDHEIIGLIVDDVYEVVQIPANQIDEPPVEVSSENNFLMGVAKYSNRLIILLNPRELLSHKEAVQLKGLTQKSK